jgi:tetratricopeptide (TPR) repeat protein
MQESKCCGCGLTGPARSFYSLNGQIYCEPCVWKASKEAAARNEPAEYISLGYDTACARCGKDSGSVVLTKVGNTPLCTDCQQIVYNWPYPRWLKLSLAFLLALLVISLWHGKKYFVAGKSLYVGERLVEEHNYAQAIPYLKSAVDIAPQSDKAVLLYAIACLRTGGFMPAMEAIDKHNSGHFEDANNPLFAEANQLAERAGEAYKKAQEAFELAKKSGHAAEAAQKMRAALSSIRRAWN